MEAIINKNPKLWMIVVYLFLVAAFIKIQPAIAFGIEGRIRPFGTGRDSTVFPVWWWMFVFAVVSYLSIVYISK